MPFEPQYLAFCDFTEPKLESQNISQVSEVNLVDCYKGFQIYSSFKSFQMYFKINGAIYK